MRRRIRIALLLLLVAAVAALSNSTSRRWLLAEGRTALAGVPRPKLEFGQPDEGHAAAPSFADVAASANPAVVNVSGLRKVPLSPQQGALPDLSGEDEDALPGTPQSPSLTLPAPALRQRSQASGFVIRSDGTIVTSSRAVNHAEKIVVRFPADPRPYQGTVVAFDPPTDLAVVKVTDRADSPSLAFSDSAKTRVGDWVLAVGNPFGLEQTVTAGIVSARGAAVGPAYDEFLQVNASINPGDAGGPLLNLDGEVVGINSATLRSAGGNVGIAFALSSDSAKRVIADLESKGKVVRGWIGASAQPLTEELAESLGLSEPRGALVAQVEPGGPAAKAGVERGDVIVQYAGAEVVTSTDLPRRVATTSVGSDVELVLLREGKKRTVTVSVAEMPAPEQGEALSGSAEKQSS